MLGKTHPDHERFKNSPQGHKDTEFTRIFLNILWNLVPLCPGGGRASFAFSRRCNRETLAGRAIFASSACH